ncbi:MAG: nitroreductase family protein [Paludibacteraceae bacterium]|nr:nitroreductase family protein [Paludibacteraceae bacterium]MBN2787149.1 nitroreductase family protein [Paludibacteraceae bacterium]
MIKTLTNHRSIRTYTSQQIDKQTMAELLEASCRASNTGNMQTYSIIVSTDEKIKAALAPYHFNQKMVTQAPAVVTFCVDFNRFNKWCQQRNAVPGYDNFLSFSSGMIDATLAAQNFCLAAESKGLGICYLGTTTYTAKKIIEILKLPKFVVPVTTVTVGYPNETPNLEDRLPLEGVVHYETYKDYLPTDIDTIYREKESSEKYKQFTAENNKETLAQVFTDVRYTKANNEHFSKELLAVLKEQGFWE